MGNNTIHSSTGAKLVEAHKDENRVNVKVNLTLKQKHFRKYPQLTVGDKVKIYTKGAGNYISRKETNSRWSDRIYGKEKIDRQGYDTTKILLTRRIKKDVFDA